MASANGFGLTASPNNILFAYDTGDVANSFKGMPGYNVIGNPFAWIGDNDSANYKTKTGTTTENIPGMGGPQQVYYVDIYNNFPSSGNCCPSLWRYGDWGVSAGVTGSTLYTYSMIYKCKSGYTHPNYMYQYQYNSAGSYLTEFGVFDYSKQIALGNDWYYAWNTFTTQPTCATIYPGCWYYQYGVYDTVYVAGVNMVKGDYKIPPRNFLSAYENRTSTQSIFNLKNQSGVNVASVSFNGNAQPYFDGTDDVLLTTNEFPSSLSQYTIEYVANLISPNRMPIASQVGNAFYKYGDNSWYYTHGGSAAEFYYPGGQITGWGYWAITYDGSNVKVYRNGQYLGAQASSGTANFSGGWRIGYWSPGGGYAWNGEIPVVKIYNKALTEAETFNNYQNYKTRFNLP